MFELSQRTTNVAINLAAIEIRAVANVPIRLYELGLTLQAATASTWGLGRPANVPAGGAVVGLLSTENGAVSGSGIVLSGQTTAPTVPAQFFRRIGFAATIGLGIIWVFRSGIYIPAGTSLVLWNITAVGVADVYISGDAG